MKNLQTLRPVLDSSSPAMLWPQRGFPILYNQLLMNATAAREDGPKEFTYCFKEDIPDIGARFISLSPGGVYSHNNLGDEFGDAAFSKWFKKNINQFGILFRYCKKHNHRIGIYGKFHQHKFHVYFLVVNHKVIIRPTELTSVFTDRNVFTIPPIISRINIYFTPGANLDTSDYYKHFPPHQSVAFPDSNSTTTYVDMAEFEALAFTSYYTS